MGKLLILMIKAQKSLSVNLKMENLIKEIMLNTIILMEKFKIAENMRKEKLFNDKK
jgi:hypothetical protein